MRAGGDKGRSPKMTRQGYSYKIFARSDYSAFWALFTDNLVNLMVLSGVCQFLFRMPPEIVYGRIVPGRPSPSWPGSRSMSGWRGGSRSGPGAT